MTWTTGYPASTSQVLGLQRRTTTPALHLFLWSSPQIDMTHVWLGGHTTNFVRVFFFLQAQLLVPMAAFTAPTRGTSLCTSSPAGSTTACVVRACGCSRGVGKEVWPVPGGLAHSRLDPSLCLRLLRRHRRVQQRHSLREHLQVGGALGTLHLAGLSFLICFLFHLAFAF